MRIHDMGDTLRVHPEHNDPSYLDLCSMLMGSTQRKGDFFFTAENNLVNRIVLGLDPLSYSGREIPTKMTMAWEDTCLENYQKADVFKGAYLGNFLNLNKMGFGKTVEAIETLRSWDIKSAVIIAPKQVCPQWVEHFWNWYPEVAVNVGLHDFSAPIVVTNYEKILRSDNLSSLRNYRRDAVIYDEIHLMKNKDAKRTIAAKQIPARYHMGLTGTPILKQPDDLWSILNAVDWHYSGKSYWNFVKYFCNIVDGFFGREIKGVTKNASRLAILKQILELVSIRNEQIEVAYGKKCFDIKLPMEESQMALYKKIKKLTLDELPENCTIANGAVLALRLQQTTSWPGLFEFPDPGAKFSWIENFCKNTDEQVVIFTKFAKTAYALRSYLATKKLSSVLYLGSQRPQENAYSKEKFTSGATQILIGTIGAAGTGLDGLQCARLGIMIEKDWSPEINQQCEDRLHRRGQGLPVFWYYLECEKSFDQHVGKINLSKSEAIRAVLERDD